MKLGVLTVLFSDLPVVEVLDRAVALGLGAVEFGTGNFPGSAHCDPAALLADPAAAEALQSELAQRDLTLSALSQHGNPLHPDPEIAASAHAVWRRTLQLAERFEVPVVNAFSGCPGDYDGAKHPNWVTCAWPSEFSEILDWQWREKVIPYWGEEAEVAKRHGVKIAFEAHPGMVVYNPRTLLRLRAECGEQIGANLDPSHLIWQGIDPLESVRELGAAEAIFHVHAKDVELQRANVARNGVLDTVPYELIRERSWNFRTCGYGHSAHFWRQFISELRKYDYDYVLSIEHEDPVMAPSEGLTKAVAVLADALIYEPAGEMYWA